MSKIIWPKSPKKTSNNVLSLSPIANIFVQTPNPIFHLDEGVELTPYTLWTKICRCGCFSQQAQTWRESCDIFSLSFHFHLTWLISLWWLLSNLSMHLKCSIQFAHIGVTVQFDCNIYHHLICGKKSVLKVMGSLCKLHNWIEVAWSLLYNLLLCKQ